MEIPDVQSWRLGNLDQDLCLVWLITTITARLDLAGWMSFCPSDADRVRLDVHDTTRINCAECFTIFGVLRIRKWTEMNLIRLQA